MLIVNNRKIHFRLNMQSNFQTQIQIKRVCLKKSSCIGDRKTTPSRLIPCQCVPWENSLCVVCDNNKKRIYHRKTCQCVPWKKSLCVVCENKKITPLEYYSTPCQCFHRYAMMFCMCEKGDRYC